MPSPPSTRIAFFSHSGALAGAERALVYAVQQARPLGFEPRVYLPGAGPLAQELESLGVATEVYPSFKQFDVVPDWWTVNHWHNIWSGFGERVAAVRAQLAAAGVGAVYVNTIYPVEGAFAAAHLGLPLAWHPHELYHEQFHDWLLGMPLFEALMGALSDVVIAVSSPCLDELRPYVPAEKLALVYEPVDWHGLQVKRAVPEDLRAERSSAPCVLACVGSIDKRKAQHDLLEALTLLPGDLSERCLTWIVGTPSGPEFEEAFQRQVAALPPRVRVRWLGQRPDVAAILQAADALVHPAINDPFPLAVLEAMACGKPVVAARGGGVTECIEEGVTGFLVPVSAPPALAVAIAEVLRDPARRAAMGSAGRVAVLKYDLAAYAKGISSVLAKFDAARPDFPARRTLAEDFERRVALLARSLSLPQPAARPVPTLSHRVVKTLRGIARKVARG